MPIRIVVLEDDYLDWEWVSEALKEEFGVVPEWISTEKKFIEQLPKLANDPPDFFVLDVMLPWDVPQRDQDKPEFTEEVGSGGIYTAGLRCLERIRQTPALAKKPYVLYTGVDRNNFPEYVVHTKSDNIRPLVDEIRQRVRVKD